MRVRSLMVGVLVLCVLLLGVMPVAAQDGGVQDGVIVPDLVLVIGTVAVAVLLALFGLAIERLYRSMPPTVQTIFETVLPPLMELVEKQTTKSETKIDDAALTQIEAWLRARGLLTTVDFPPPNTGPPVG